MIKSLCIRRNTYTSAHLPLNKTWCGRDIEPAERVFATIDSAIINRLFLGKLTVCSACWAMIETVIERDKKTRERESNDN